MFASRTNWPLEPNRLAQVLEDHRRSGKPLLDLTNSNPTTRGFAYPEQEILRALGDPRALEYHPESKGLLSARQAVAEYYLGHPGFSSSASAVDPERIILTSGTSEGYTYVFRLLCEPGDEVLVPAPSYPLFEFLANIADIRLAPYPLVYDHGWQIDFGGLRAVLTPRARAVLVVHPNNPTGSFVRPREAAELERLCASREIAIVADEVFLDYADAGVRTSTFAHGSAALSFVLSGISKLSALPQMKLAWVVVSGPDALARTTIERLDVIADTYLSPGTPVQLALPKFLALGADLRAQVQRRVAANLAFLDAALRGAASITRLEREGGWYAVLRVPAAGPDDVMAATLLERCSVLVHPGRFFDFPREGYLVLSLITPETEFQEGTRRLLRFF